MFPNLGIYNATPTKRYMFLEFLVENKAFHFSKRALRADTACNKYIKKTPPGIIYPFCILPKFSDFFVAKLKLLRKSSDVLLLGVTNITLVLRFMKSNKFHYVQTTKVVNSKDVSP